MAIEYKRLTQKELDLFIQSFIFDCHFYFLLDVRE